MLNRCNYFWVVGGLHKLRRESIMTTEIPTMTSTRNIINLAANRRLSLCILHRCVSISKFSLSSEVEARRLKKELATRRSDNRHLRWCAWRDFLFVVTCRKFVSHIQHWIWMYWLSFVTDAYDIISDWDLVANKTI